MYFTPVREVPFLITCNVDVFFPTLVQGAAGCVVAFSTTDRDSFDAVESWIQKVEDEVPNVPMVLVQNKIDLVDQAVMVSCYVCIGYNLIRARPA